MTAISTSKTTVSPTYFFVYIRDLFGEQLVHVTGAEISFLPGAIRLYNAHSTTHMIFFAL